MTPASDEPAQIHTSGQPTAYDGLTLARRVMEEMLVASDLSGVAASIAKGIVNCIGAALASVWIYARDNDCPICREKGPPHGESFGDELALHRVAYACIAPTFSDTQHRLRLGQSHAGLVGSERKAILANELVTDERLDSFTRGLVHDLGLVAYAGYPLLYQNQLLGVLGSSFQHQLTSQQFANLEIFALEAALVLRASGLMAELEMYRSQLQAENTYLRQEIDQVQGYPGIVTKNPTMIELLHQADVVAPTDTTVLITGETGTGKELVARRVHALSRRADRPLITMNSGAMVASLAESELFGHERGAFTGATQRRQGRFELANGGTLFIDEIGELSLELQVKLLRVLQEREFERVGGSRVISADVRIVAATNRALDEEVRAGRFRADLYYRLNVFPLRVPPLRERLEDIPALVAHYLERLSGKLGKPLRGVSARSLKLLQRYSWPGNIRELQNVIERACVLATSPVVDIHDPALAAAPLPHDSQSELQTIDDVERAHIKRVLGFTSGRIDGAGGAAKILGVPPSTLRSRMNKLGIVARSDSRDS